MSTERFLASAVVPYLAFVQQAAAQTNPPIIQQQANATGNFSVYQNHPYGFRLEYPSNWILFNDTQLDEQNNAFAYFRSAQTGSDFEIHVYPSAAASSLQQFTTNRTNYLQQQFGATPTTPNSTSVAGVPANEIFFYLPGTQSAAAVTQVLMVNNDNGYIFTYIDPDISKYTMELPVIKEMINSFQPVSQQRPSYTRPLT
ncbi:MAG: PsbP-related protein [Candidatus Nitrosopolaris sp.]